jgi:hypothetical protein
MLNMVRVGISYAKEIAVTNTPVLTGHLKAEWKESPADHFLKTMTFLGLGWQGSWYNDVEYALYVDEGTGLYGPEHRKYLILPKTPGGTLHWVDKLTGKDVYAKRVLHPGSPGHHMLQTSADALEVNWVGLMRPVLDNWAHQVERQNPYAVIT